MVRRLSRFGCEGVDMGAAGLRRSEMVLEKDWEL